MGTTRKRTNYTPEERSELVRRFKVSGLGRQEFCKQHSIAPTTLFMWLQQEGLRPPRQKRTPAKGPIRTGRVTGPFPAQERKEAVEAFLKSGLSLQDFCRTWGISDARTLDRWVTRYQNDGPQSLEHPAPRKPGSKKGGAKPLSRHVTREISLVKTLNPEFGLKKVRDFLRRFRGVDVSVGSIRKTIREEDLPLAQRPKRRRRAADRIRRFERARPMQLWQSDITSFVLARHSTRVYLTVFMDDQSRYIVAWNLQLRQTSEFVMTALLDGISRFGKPEEVLTDQGRQYFAWRGKGDFQKLLEKEGIRHVVARSHHPQTLGKCERFWETAGVEFWDRVRPEDLNDARERLSHFIAHYNHSRPHQGIDGLVPADRFFGLESEIRKAIEATLSQNELRIALDEAPRAPVFLLGQIGDQTISLHGEGGAIVLRAGDGPEKRIESASYGHSKPPYLNPSPTGGAERDERGIIESGEDKETDPSHFHRPVSGHSSTGIMGSGEPRRASESASGGHRDHGVLAGILDQERHGEDPRSPSHSSLADVTAGDLGYAGSTAEPTSYETKEDDRALKGCGQRNEFGDGSEAIASQDPGPRTHDRDPNEADRDPAGVPGPERSEPSSSRTAVAQSISGCHFIHPDAEAGDPNEVPRNREQKAWETANEGQAPSSPEPNDDDSTPGRSS